METIKLTTWQAVSDYIDAGAFQIRMSQFEHLQQHANYYPRHAYSKGQLASNSWLLGELKRIDFAEDITVAILGSWIGTLVDPLHQMMSIARVYGIDADPECVTISEKLNQEYLEGWRYKGVCADVTQLDCSNMQFETGGELIDVTPHIVINTSSEHMNTEWFDTVSKQQLIVMQTNNSTEFDGHVNVCSSIEHMQELYPLSYTAYVGEMQTPAYTRYMQIGFK